VNDNNKQADINDFEYLSAYAPNKLVKNDVKNSSTLSHRLYAFGIAFLLHALFIVWLDHELGLMNRWVPQELITLLEFIEPEEKPVPAEPQPDINIEKPKQKDTAAPKTQTANIRAESAVEKEISTKKKRIEPLRLYNESGRVSLPIDFIEKLDADNAASRKFDFINPDLELGGTFLKKPPAIDFDPTQFEQAWKPDQDILTELLEKAVEKTTKEIKIPVPGNPTVKLVCKVSVLALGGGCGFVPNGGYGRVIPDNEDDPDTLSPEEDRECQAWWEKISSTSSRREWLKTRELYEITCKKPLAKVKVP
jgi:hypothetical protein